MKHWYAEWQRERAAGDTTLGFWDWLYEAPS